MKQLLLFAALLFSTVAFAQSRTNGNDQPEELGKVSWYRDYDAALAEAQRQDKPVLILFQEVPGCATCQQYGNTALSHPLMVEGIENEFIPLAIFNNKGGNDRKVLEKYGEPSWNNPVVRIVDEKGEDYVDRVAGNYSPGGLLGAMKLALFQTGDGWPGYLEALESELTATTGQVEEAYFEMYCFWSGEHHLGNHDAVLTTEPGFMGGHEVVKLSYDPTKVNAEDLARYAAKKDIKPAAPKAGYRTATKDHYYQLQKTDFVYLPLTEVQKTKINSGLHRGQDVTGFLSPSQLAHYNEVRKARNKPAELYTMAFPKAWATMARAKK